MKLQHFLSGLLLAVFFTASQGNVYAAVEPKAPEVSLGELESFTDQINALTRAMDEQKLQLERLKKEREALSAEASETAEKEAAEKKDPKTLDRQIKELEAAYANNEKELEKYSSRIEKSNGFAPELFRSSALSESSKSH